MLTSKQAARKIIEEHFGGSSAGLLRSLQPLNGPLVPKCEEIMEAILVIGEGLSQGDNADLLVSIWSICFNVRTAALKAEGAIRRNKLMDNGSLLSLEEWIDGIELASLRLATHRSIEDAILALCNVILKTRTATRVESFVELLLTGSSSKHAHVRESVAMALGQLGKGAASAVPALLALARDVDNDVADAATNALRSIKGSEG